FVAPCGQSFPQPVQKYRCTPGTPPVPFAQDYAFAARASPPRVFVAATFRWALLPSSSVGFSLRQRNNTLSRSNACPAHDYVILFSPSHKNSNRNPTPPTRPHIATYRT